MAQSEPAEKSLYASLVSIFAACAQAEIKYALLRGYDELATAHGPLEVDLLVAPEDLSRFAEILARRNFVALPNWGHAPHHFFLGFEEESGSWLKFDVVTELCYGAPVRALRVALAEECLQKRRRCAPTYVLSPEHELLTLFLHCLLDKKSFREARRARLLELHEAVRRESSAHQRCQQLVEIFLAPALTWKILDQALARQDWQALLQLRQAIMKRLQQGQRAAVLRRKVNCLMFRKLRPLLFASQRRGLFVALLAPDGAGKSTLAQALKRDFGLQAQLIYMGTNIAASTIGLPTTKWLHRTLKNARVPKPLRVLLKPVNYCNRIAELWYRIACAHWQRWRGKCVVFDRYVYDSWIAKPATTWAKRLRRNFLEAGWPTPHMVILLDAPGELLFRRKGEHSPEWLEKQREAYLALQKQLPQMRVIDATQEAEEVRRATIALIWAMYRKKSL
ncbi:hypothetical protein HUU05_06990 [candidate division KSB1 bacterium]|nr:hypothetical protein [candidate division KSB1 bacterium]